MKAFIDHADGMRQIPLGDLSIADLNVLDRLIRRGGNEIACYTLGPDPDYARGDYKGVEVGPESDERMASPVATFRFR